MIIKKHLRTLGALLAGILLSGQLFAAARPDIENPQAKRVLSIILIEEGNQPAAVTLRERQSISAMNYAPIAGMILLGFILFRKEEPEVEDEPEEAVVPVKKPVKVEKATPDVVVEKATLDVKKEEVKSVKPIDDITDLSIDQEQCQSTTAKKTRCKRKTSLERIIVSINKQKYRFMSCRQHSNNFKPHKDEMK